MAEHAPSGPGRARTPPSRTHSPGPKKVKHKLPEGGHDKQGQVKGPGQPSPHRSQFPWSYDEICGRLERGGGWGMGDFAADSVVEELSRKEWTHDFRLRAFEEEHWVQVDPIYKYLHLCTELLSRFHLFVATLRQFPNLWLKRTSNPARIPVCFKVPRVILFLAQFLCRRNPRVKGFYLVPNWDRLTSLGCESDDVVFFRDWYKRVSTKNGGDLRQFLFGDLLNIALVWAADKDSSIVHRFPAVLVVPFESFASSSITQNAIARLKNNLVAALCAACSRTGLKPKQLLCSVRFSNKSSILPELLDLALLVPQTLHYKTDSKSTRNSGQGVEVTVKNSSLYRHVLSPLFQMIVLDSCKRVQVGVEPESAGLEVWLADSVFNSITRSVNRSAVNIALTFDLACLVQQVDTLCALRREPKKRTPLRMVMNDRPDQVINPAAELGLCSTASRLLDSIKTSLLDSLFEPVLAKVAQYSSTASFYIPLEQRDPSRSATRGPPRPVWVALCGVVRTSEAGDGVLSDLWSVVPNVGLGQSDVGLYKATDQLKMFGLLILSPDKVTNLQKVIGEVTLVELVGRAGPQGFPRLQQLAKQLSKLKPCFQPGLHHLNRPRFSVSTTYKIMLIVKYLRLAHVDEGTISKAEAMAIFAVIVRTITVAATSIVPAVWALTPSPLLEGIAAEGRRLGKRSAKALHAAEGLYSIMKVFARIATFAVGFSSDTAASLALSEAAVQAIWY